jgi:hypothetical protein
MSPWIQYSIAFVVACHGFIYIPLLFVPDMLKGWRGRSWLLGSAITGDRLKVLAAALHVSAGVLILASALAIAFAPLVPGWWAPLAIAGSALGMAGFAVFWDGQTGRVVEEGGIGAALSVILLASAVAFPNAFG